jgi:hypothetical protein
MILQGRGVNVYSISMYQPRDSRITRYSRFNKPVPAGQVQRIWITAFGRRSKIVLTSPENLEIKR